MVRAAGGRFAHRSGHRRIKKTAPVRSLLLALILMRRPFPSLTQRRQLVPFLYQTLPRSPLLTPHPVLFLTPRPFPLLTLRPSRPLTQLPFLLLKRLQSLFQFRWRKDMCIMWVGFGFGRNRHSWYK